MKKNHTSHKKSYKTYFGYLSYCAFDKNIDLKIECNIFLERKKNLFNLHSLIHGLPKSRV